MRKFPRRDRVLRVAVHGEVGRDRLGELLAEVAAHHVVSEYGLAGRRLTRPRDDAHERRLAEAVVADHRHLVAARDVEGHVVEDVLHAVVGEEHVLTAEHLDAGRRRLGETQAPAPRVALREHDALLVDLVDELLAALRLRGLRGLRAEAVHEPLELLAVVVLVLLRGDEVLVAHLALAEVPVEVALVARARAGVHLHDDARERLEQVAVVRDEHERAAVELEVALEPVDGGEVEVVGRLVEQEEVRLARKHARELRAHAPAAGEGRERLRELLHGEAERGLHLAVLLQHLRLARVEARLECLHLRLKLAEARHAAHRVLEERLVRRVRLGVLPRGPDRGALLDHEFPVVRGKLAEDGPCSRGS